jgi:hypothetical protein
MRAITVVPGAPGRECLQEREAPVRGEGELLVEMIELGTW